MKRLATFLIAVLMCTSASAQHEKFSSTGTVRVNGAALSYYVEGTGVPCLMLGIPPFHRRTFSPELRKHIQFIFTDSRLSVPTDSSMDWKTVTIDTMVEDVEQLRRALKCDRIGVMGNSAFGIVALEYARKYPQHTSHVIMIGTNPVWPYDSVAAAYWETQASAERKVIFAENQKMSAGTAGDSASGEKYLQGVYEDTESRSAEALTPSEELIRVLVAEAPKYWYDPRFDCSQIFAGCYWNMAGLEQLLGPMLTGYDATAGPEVHVPVFIAHGKHDYDTPYVLWNDKKGKFANATFSLFEKSGHFPMYDEQAEFDKQLIVWLDRH